MFDRNKFEITLAITDDKSGLPLLRALRALLYSWIRTPSRAIDPRDFAPDGAKGATLDRMDRPAERSVIEPLSPRLHALVLTLSRDTGALIQRVVDIVKDGIPDYTLSADPAMKQQLWDSVVLHLGIWYGCLLAAQPPTEEMLGPVEAAARRRVHQGVSLAGMLRAFRIGSRGFWVGLLEAAGDDTELHNELLFKVSPYLLHHFDVIAQAVSQAYLDEQLQHARWRDRLRQELWNVISARPDDTEAFRRHAEALGLDVWSPHCAVVLRLGGATEASPVLESAVNRLLVRVSECWAVPVESLMRALHHDHLVLWFPVLRGETLVDTDRRLAAQAGELTARSQTVIGAGVGLPGSAARGWWLSMQQAFRALESGGSGAGPPALLRNPVRRRRLDIGQRAALPRRNDRALDRRAAPSGNAAGLPRAAPAPKGGSLQAQRAPEHAR